MNNWQKTGSGKKIKFLSDKKVVVISPEDTYNVIPLFCECCNRPMKSSEDALTYRKLQICHKCDERWTNKPGVEWPGGPNKETKEWKEYIATRNLLEKPILDFR